MGAGLLYAAIIVGWAAYLIPHALRRYDQASRSRSIDRFSAGMRVLGRKPAVDSLATVKPSGPPSGTADGQRATSRRTRDRGAARAAAQRRRRVLTILLLLTFTTVCVAGLSYLPWWTVTVPAAATSLFLFACSRRVRRDRADRDVVESPEPVSRPAARVDFAYGLSAHAAAPTATTASATGEVSPDDEPTVVIAREDLAQVTASVETSHDGALWDPVPVTLPTYVSKPKAHRTIRTIDLAQPGTWTSGHTEEATALAEQAADAKAAESEAEESVEQPRRAVGG